MCSLIGILNTHDAKVLRRAGYGMYGRHHAIRDVLYEAETLRARALGFERERMWDIEDAIALYRFRVELRGDDAGRGPWEQM